MSWHARDVDVEAAFVEVDRKRVELLRAVREAVEEDDRALGLVPVREEPREAVDTDA